MAKSERLAYKSFLNENGSEWIEAEQQTEEKHVYTFIFLQASPDHTNLSLKHQMQCILVHVNIL